MSDKHPEIECYECGRLKTRIIWQGRCVTCAVQRLEFNLEENDTLRSENAAIKEENERLSDGLSHHMNISQVLADGNANMYEMVMERDAEIELLKARVAELESKDPNLINTCGCRFENDTGNSVLLCEACSELPCHNPNAETKEPSNEG